jgi:endonuclease G, mitochondrial
MTTKEERIAIYMSRIARKRDLNELLRTKVQEAGPESAGQVSKQVLENYASASAGVQEILQGRVPSQQQAAGLEAIILPKIRPVLDVIGGDFHTDHPLWQMLNDDQAIRGRLRKALHSIGRIDLPGNTDYPYGGTGFIVGDGLIMTNRHVAEIFSSGLGTRQLNFKSGFHAGINFLHELDSPPGNTLMVRRIILIHPYWDMALLSVEGLPDDSTPLFLSLRDIPADPVIDVAAIGYPAFDYRNDAGEQNDLFRNVFGVKRLQPGTLGGRQNTESFGKLVPALQHNCSTLGGNSGSALIDFKEGEVIALHFGGRFHDINYGVPACELAKDGRVVDAGVTFTGKAPGGVPPWENWWNGAHEAFPDSNAVGPDVPANDGTHLTPLSRTPRTPKVTMTPEGAVQFVVPLVVTVSLGGAAKEMPAGVEAASRDVETMAAPWHDDNYVGRKGFDEKFLKTVDSVPMPKPEDPAVVARAKDGSTVLQYQNFSIVMHAKRRLALFTASNLTAETKLKKPESGRDYTRKGLSGLGKNDQEQWLVDPRLDNSYQLSDFFYTRDDGAFDKGHIVRREDVAWGETYDLVRRANGDTYHVTNCSPQVAGFNRSNLGQDNWGNLENHVLKSAATERYCLFAGPVLDPNDETFVGKIGKGTLVRVKIPSRFWKVIVARTTTTVASYGFLLEQDLSDVPLVEFAVPKNFRRLMVPLRDLQKLAGIKFPDLVLNADQFETNEGVELALRAGLTRQANERGQVTESVFQ